MVAIVYILITLTCLLCAVLLLRAYVRTGTRLLFWSGLCFAGFTLSNSLVYIDLILFNQIDLYPVRLSIATLSLALLVYGLVWEAE